MDWDKTFNHHRWVALAFLLCAAVIGWYSLILMTNPIGNSPNPDTPQWWALGVTVALAFGAWVSRCLTIVPY